MKNCLKKLNDIADANSLTITPLLGFALGIFKVSFTVNKVPLEGQFDVDHPFDNEGVYGIRIGRVADLERLLSPPEEIPSTEPVATVSDPLAGAPSFSL